MMSKRELGERRALMRRIRKALLPRLTNRSAVPCLLFTTLSAPRHWSPAARTARSVRYRRLPCTDETFCGFSADGILLDYMMGCVTEAPWRNVKTSTLRHLADIVEAEGNRYDSECERDKRVLAEAA